MNEIKAQYEHSKFGTFMFDLCAKWTKFLVKHRWLYYLLACTWGIILTLFGLLITFILWVASANFDDISFKKYYWIYYIKAGPNYWGGFETGLMFVRDQYSAESLNQHEWGHTAQNCLFGMFTVFLITIPSAIRYWYQTIRDKKGLSNKPYDAFWAEDSASQCGKYMVEYLNKDL